ncbi:MAG: FAD-dependent oxidoreductase, partial [Pseudomonadales bacterium]|nr:FAD-dependent oxidoreductase [Pseudomonadales bacterium]
MSDPGNASVNHPLLLAGVPGWDATVDVLIVGYGAAGACAALEAARAGAEVCIVEASGTYGGASALSSGEIYAGGGGGTPIQRAAGYEDASDDMYRYLMMAGGPDADTAKVRLYVDRSLEHFDWMQQQGVPFKNSHIRERILEPATDDCLVWSGSEEAWPFSAHARPCPRGFMPQWT